MEIKVKVGSTTEVVSPIHNGRGIGMSTEISVGHNIKHESGESPTLWETVEAAWVRLLSHEDSNT
jgi:hypothetical protein